MPSYPKVNYIGNKEKITDWIISELPIKRGKVVVIFAGGCSVSYALKKAGYAVIANDILYADYVIAKALIENSEVNLNPSVVEKKIDKRRIRTCRKKVEFLENKLYYPEEIDELAQLVAISETLDGEEKYLFLALLRRAMIRKLPYSRMNIPWEQIQLLRDEEYSYQKYKRKRAYHNKSFTSHILENIDGYNNSVFEAEECLALSEDVLEISNHIDEVDIVYMDPPYPSTMNNYDSFYGLFDEIFGKKRKHIDFTNKATFLANMEKLITSLSSKTKYIVLSQNTRVLPGPEDIESMLKKFGKVTVRETRHNYQVTGKENKNSSNELLFVVKIDKFLI